MTRKKRTFVSFDWALKHLLREKANHDVLEGFVSVILGKTITIKNLLESESNKDDEESKSNRVDLLAQDENGDLLLIEVQGEPEQAYFQRMLFGASKLVTEYIESGERSALGTLCSAKNYEQVKRVYSINIVYFDLGQGEDCVYEGKTEFRGLNKGDVLRLSPFQQQKFQADAVSDLYPRYFILKVNDFNRWSRVPLDQWLYFLSTSDIPEDADAPGLKEAREKLDLMRMSRDERVIYDRYLMDRAILRNTVDGARDEGRYEGMKEGMEKGLQQGLEQGLEQGLQQGLEQGLQQGLQQGLEQGLEQGLQQGLEQGLQQGVYQEKVDNARKMKAHGIATDMIAQITGLGFDEIERL